MIGVRNYEKSTEKNRKSNLPEFKREAIDLAREIGALEAAEKLGIPNPQTIGSWLRYDKRITEDAEFHEHGQARKEIKKLRKQADEDKKVIAILRDATAFFCQDQWKLSIEALSFSRKKVTQSENDVNS